ncbi:leucine-rich repeat domain-containing protein, partial [Bifidobacterium boum]
IAQCFPDKLLAQAIAYKLKGGPGWTGEVLTSKDVDDTWVLSPNPLAGLPGFSGISSVQGLQVFTNLISLDLRDTQVSDVSPLSNLVNLIYLSLDGTRVLDLSPLSNLHRASLTKPTATGVHPSVKLTVNADGSVSLPAPRWWDGSFVAPSSTSPVGGVLDAKRGVVTWKGYDAKALYFYNFEIDPHLGNFSGRVTGVKPAGIAAMFRLYNPNSGEHFYTGNAVERDGLVRVGWKSEGTGWVAPAGGNPVYRLYNPNAGDHHYTLNKAERDNLVRLGWRYEGVGWHSASSASGPRRPLYREYNPNARAGAHNYTLNKAENDMLVRVGWRYEGVAWYAAGA